MLPATERRNELRSLAGSQPGSEMGFRALIGMPVKGHAWRPVQPVALHTGKLPELAHPPAGANPPALEGLGHRRIIFEFHLTE
ncbi:hypothetical protein NKJ81_29245 [Mesorhizobium sp. M0018]|uniref:hypothetical protein n=1 Tax=unclassified Mesorhizobium TaxID=325217 RepID=UPI00333C050A